MPNDKVKYCGTEDCFGHAFGVSAEKRRCPDCGSRAYGKTISGVRDGARNIAELGGKGIEGVKFLGNKIGRRRMKKGLIGALVGSALTAASFFGYHALENRWNSPEYLREKDLDEKAAFLLNGASTCFNDSYLLPNGLKVEVKKDYRHNFLPGTSDRLELKFHRVEMRSEYDGLRTLDQIMFFDAQTGTLVIRERDQIPNYPEWQVKYEELIEQTAIAKKAHLEEEKRKQDEAIKRVEEKLKSGELLRGEKNE